MNDDLTLLASRYLDGDVSPGERARVDGDEELRAEVERLAGAREALADVEAPSAGAREAAVAAALAAFRAPIAPSASRREVTPPPPASLAARRRARWLMPAAAAVVGVLAIGAVAVLSTDRGDDDAASDATEAAGAAATDGGTELTAREQLEAADIAGSPAEVPEPAATSSAAAEATGASSATNAPGTSVVASRVVLSTPTDLRAFVADAPSDTAAATMSDLSADDDAARKAARCDIGTTVGPAYYLVEGEQTFVLVVVAGNEVLAVTADCEIVAASVVALTSRSCVGGSRHGTTLVSMLGNPFNNPDWAPDLADTVERLVGTVRDKTTKPAIKGARALVFGLLASFLAVTALVLVVIILTRGLQSLLDLAVTWAQAVYISYFIIGGILCLAGLLILKMRRTTDA